MKILRCFLPIIHFSKKLNYFLITVYCAIFSLQLFFIIHGFSGMPDLVGKAVIITLATPYIIYVLVKEFLFIAKGPNDIVIYTENATANLGDQEITLSENKNIVVVENLKPFYTLIVDGTRMPGYYVLKSESLALDECRFLHLIKRN